MIIAYALCRYLCPWGLPALTVVLPDSDIDTSVTYIHYQIETTQGTKTEDGEYQGSETQLYNLGGGTPNASSLRHQNLSRSTLNFSALVLRKSVQCISVL